MICLSVFVFLMLALGPFAPIHKESQYEIKDAGQQEHESNDKEGQESPLEIKDARGGLLERAGLVVERQGQLDRVGIPRSLVSQPSGSSPLTRFHRQSLTRL